MNSVLNNTTSVRDPCGPGGSCGCGCNTVSLRIEVEDQSIFSELYGAVRTNHRSDSGFDLFMPADLILGPRTTTFIDLGVRCQIQDPTNRTFGYYLYPRSSISKTPLRLANSVGIIDAGYRGILRVAVDNIGDTPYYIRRGDRLFQLCLPSLLPFQVVFAPVDRDTERGEGGFGSTNSFPTIQ